jgi:ferredoxin
MIPEPPDKLAGRLGLDAGHVGGMLDEMADKGLIYSSTRNGEKWYKLIQLVPGIFELQFMKGEITERAKELARLFDAYFHATMPLEGAKARPKETVNMARVIPIEQTLAPSMNVFPFEVTSKYIKDNSPITVSICYCRHEKRLLDRGCKYPDEVCLQLGPFAEFVKERGFGREIDKTEALDILKRSAEAGLIHTSSNTRERIDFICNCCTCCCGILQGVHRFGDPMRSVSSNFEAAADMDSCSGCGECAERCQMDAITIVDDKAKIKLERCIGCGVCVYHCPMETITLVSRTDFVEPPKSFKELIEKKAAPKK